MPKRVKCPNPVNGTHYGLKFTDGVSEVFDNGELARRLELRGYIVIEEKTVKKAKNTQKRGK